MTGAEFVKLKVGDYATIIRGKDAGRLCQVAYIEGEAVLVRSADGKRFERLAQFDTLKLTSYRELRLVKNENLETIKEVIDFIKRNV